MECNETRVAIVGAGVAGLTLAAALERRGVPCQVFEQANALRDVGAGIQLSPNATRLLSNLGISSALEPVAVRPMAIEMRRWSTDKVLMRTELGKSCEGLFHAPYYTVHRAHLHRVLRDALRQTPVHLGRRCEAVHQTHDGVEVLFSDGAQVTADVVVGADGIHSVIRRTLVDDAPRFTGQVAFRGLVDADKVPHLRDLPAVRIWLGPGQHFVCYPVSAGRLISFVATAPESSWREESWTAPAEVSDVVEAYAGWHDQVRRLIAATASVKRWALHDRELVKHWSADRITIVGDAAHPMLPFGAQGANQGIEDAVALAALLRETGTAEPARALNHYSEVRKSRIVAVRDFVKSNARNHHHGDGAQLRKRDAEMHDEWSLRAQSWLFGYDAVTAIMDNLDDGSGMSTSRP